MTLRRSLTTSIIRLGPRNALAFASMAAACLLRGCFLSRHGDVLHLRCDNRTMILAEKHFVYAHFLAGRFDIHFEPLVPTERDALFFVDLSQRAIQTYKHSGEKFVMCGWPEDYSAIQEYFRHYRPKEGDLVYNIGANCGLSTHVLSKMVGDSGRVIAFEPDTENFSCLAENSRLCGWTNVTLLNMAVGGKSGRMFFNNEGTQGSLLMDVCPREPVGVVSTVRTTSLREAFAVYGHPAFIAMDIEGSEIDALSGESWPSLHFASEMHLAIDTNHEVGGKLTTERVSALLRDAGYRVESDVCGSFVTTWGDKP